VFSFLAVKLDFRKKLESKILGFFWHFTFFASQSIFDLFEADQQACRGQSAFGLWQEAYS